MTEYYHQTQRVGACVRCERPFIGPPNWKRCDECAKIRKLETMKRYRSRRKGLRAVRTGRIPGTR